MKRILILFFLFCSQVQLASVGKQYTYNEKYKNYALFLSGLSAGTTGLILFNSQPIVGPTLIGVGGMSMICAFARNAYAEQQEINLVVNRPTLQAHTELPIENV